MATRSNDRHDWHGAGSRIGVSEPATAQKRARTRQQKSAGADYLAAMIESSGDAIVSKKLDGTITTWNSSAERIFGYGPDEIIGRNVSLIIPPERLGEEQLILERIRNGETIEHYETVRLAKGNREIAVSLTISPLRDSAGEIVGCSKIVQDITERKRLEEHLRLVIEFAPSAMVMIDASGRIEMVNAQAQRVFGYSRDELLGEPIEMLVPERFRRHHPGLRASFFNEPQSRPMGGGRDLYGLRKDGVEFPVEIGLNPIETAAGPKVLSAIVDISERKRLEEHFRLVVEFAPSAMVMIDASGQIKMVNTQAERLFGYGRAELLEQSIEMLVPDRFRGLHSGLRASFLDDPRPRAMGAGRDLYGLRKNGSEFPVEIGLNPIDTADGTMVLAAIVDISDRKHKEESIQAALKEKELLLGEIHHRVKNNLQVIISLLDLQSSALEDETAVRLLQDSQNRIRSMSLIHQTLYQSRDFARVNFGDFLDALLPALVLSYSTSPGRIGLSIDAGSVSLPIATAIPCGLLVNELVSNALKHAFPDERRGELKIVLAAIPGDRVVLSVADNGIGIPEDLNLADTATLGLQLVTLLADQLGAEIAIHRRHPTRFEFRFPVAQ